MGSRWMGGVMAMFLVATAACADPTGGSGLSRTDSRSVMPFDELDVHAARVRIVVDPSAPGDRLEVKGDDNLVPLVHTEIDGNRLTITIDEDVAPKLGLEVTLRTPRIKRVVADRSAWVDLTLSGESTLEVEAHSSAAIILHGSVARLEAELDGSARLLARELVARDVELDASGSANAAVCVTGELDVDLDGSSDAEYYCSPANVDDDVSRNSDLDAR